MNKCESFVVEINQCREFLDCGLVRHSGYLSNTVVPQKVYIRRALVLITDNTSYSEFKCVSAFSLLSHSAKSRLVSHVTSVMFSQSE